MRLNFVTVKTENMCWVNAESSQLSENMLLLMILLLHGNYILCKGKFLFNMTPMHLNESTCFTDTPLMTLGLMTVMLQHIYFVLNALLYRTLARHRLAKCTSEEI